MEELFRIGAIASTHGVHGEVKIYPTTDEVERFKDLKECLLDTGNGMMNLTIESVKYFKQFVILKFKEMSSINDIEKYRGKDLLVTRSNAIALDEDEYYFSDLIGLKVLTDEDRTFGTVKDIFHTGANDVYVIEDENGKECLFPAIHECILEICPEEGHILVHIMDGLLE